jgi:hypothetical protein
MGGGKEDDGITPIANGDGEGGGRRDDGDDDDGDDDDNVGEDAMRYYRITFRGVVSLLSDIDDARDRRGQRPTTQTMATRTMVDDPEGRWSPGDGEGNSGMYVGHGEVVATDNDVFV